MTLVPRRGKSLARLDALLEILGLGWHEAFRGDLANKTPLRFLAAGYADPDTVRRLGRARLGRFFARHSRGMWGEPKADELLVAAAETHALWAGELDYPDLAEDIAVEARLALALTDEIKELDERIAIMLDRADPAGIVRSAPGVGAITGAAILGRLGDPSRFGSLAAARSFTGLVASLDASGQAGRLTQLMKCLRACLTTPGTTTSPRAAGALRPRSRRASHGGVWRPAPRTCSTGLKPSRASRSFAACTGGMDG